MSEGRAEALRVTKPDGTRLVLHQPEIVGDTLFGVRRDVRPRDGRPRPAVALADVRGLRFDESIRSGPPWSASARWRWRG